MSLPDVAITIQDGALGLAPSNSNNRPAVVGTCSSGTNNAVYSFGAGNVQAVKDTLGTGELAEAVALIVGAGVACMACKVAQSSAGSAGAVSNSGTGTSVMTITGTPRDSYEFRVKVTKAAAAVTSGIGTFQYSLDGGRSYSNTISLPTAAAYVVADTGITINFATGTLVVDDVYSSACTGPIYTSTQLNTAIDALLADPRTWFAMLATGVPADSAAMQGIFAAIEAKMTTALGQFRFAAALMQAFDGNDAAILASGLTLSGLRTGIAPGFERMVSPISGAQYNRPQAWSIMKRLAVIPPSESAGKVATGPIGGETISIGRDENVTPGLDEAGYSTLRTIVGLPGFYATNARIKASPISDYQYFELRRVMDIACAAARIGFLRYLNDTVLVNATTGFILESEAKRIDAYVTGVVRDAVTRTQPAYASDARVICNRSDNLLSTGTLNAQVRVTPLGYLRHISVTLGFFNPALQPVQ